jgi:hypothetical protein
MPGIIFRFKTIYMKNIKRIVMMVPLFATGLLMAQEGEWQDLFNGKSIRDWKKLGGTAEFRVEDGCITGVSALNTPNTFLTQGAEYTNFILEYEMKMDQGLNSGVQIRSHSVSTYEKGRVHGLQVECDDSERKWSGGIYDEARKGWRYPLEYNPPARNAYKSSEWNKFRVLAYENHIITWINDVPCANLTEEATETGFIALQVHAVTDSLLAGRQIRWRNIRIRPAGAADFETFGKVAIPEVSYLRNSLTTSEVKAGWKLLWDGTTTAGWRGIKSVSFPEKGWIIRDGMLSVEASTGGESANGGDIVTTRLYRNFILEVDFAIADGANSGIKYFVNTELNKGEGSAIGCEFQILDDARHPDALLGVNGNRTMGSLYDLIAADARFYNPNLPVAKYVNGTGRWNRARIVVNGNRVEHYLNGCKIVEYERSTQEWRALVAYSKYKDWPYFGENREGNILLQDHGNAVSFCNIKILDLP